MHSLALRSLCLLLVLGLAPGCGYTHKNVSASTRPERSSGSAARIVMPGDPMPEARPARESEIVPLGGSSAESDADLEQRDVPLGPLAVLFGYPFWIFWNL